MNTDLFDKLKNDEQFKNEQKQKLQRFQSLQQAAAYKDLSSIPTQILQYIKSRDIYFYFGYLQPSYDNLSDLEIFLAQHLKPPTNSKFKIVFFNDCCDNYAYWSFRQILGNFPFYFISYLEELVVVKPHIYLKSLDWMTVGTIQRHLRSITHYQRGCLDLCKHLNLSIDAIIDNVPKSLYQEQFSQFYAQTMPLLAIKRLQTNSTQTVVNTKNKENQIKNIQNIIVKLGKQVNLLQNYQICEFGIPTILKMLIYYFDKNTIALESEGLFRKSVSVDDEELTVANLMKHNYDYLMDVSNPHIIANLIKKFFSSLKIPIIPFQHFNKLMNDDKKQDKVEHLYEVVQTLPELNKFTLSFMLNFLKEQVIVREQSNKMGEKNVAICFAPCWFRSEKSSFSDFLFASKAVEYAKIMIENFQKVFGSKEEQEEYYSRRMMNENKIFNQNLDIGIEQALKVVDKNCQQNNVRFSNRFSTQIESNQNNPIFLIDNERNSNLNNPRFSNTFSTNQQQSALTFQILQHPPQNQQNSIFKKKQQSSPQQPQIQIQNILEQQFGSKEEQVEKIRKHNQQLYQSHIHSSQQKQRNIGENCLVQEDQEESLLFIRKSVSNVSTSNKIDKGNRESYIDDTKQNDYIPLVQEECEKYEKQSL